MVSESLGNSRIPDVRLVRLMSKWENPTFVLQIYRDFYYLQYFCDIFLLKNVFLEKNVSKSL